MTKKGEVEKHIFDAIKAHDGKATFGEIQRFFTDMGYKHTDRAISLNLTRMEKSYQVAHYGRLYILLDDENRWAIANVVLLEILSNVGRLQEEEQSIISQHLLYALERPHAILMKLLGGKLDIVPPKTPPLSDTFNGIIKRGGEIVNAKQKKNGPET